MNTGKPALYNIPAGIPFGDALAAGLLEETGHDPLTLASYHIFLPTRRACRNLRETFLRLSEGRPLLLPRLQPIGDIDEEELTLEIAGKETASEMLALPPALSPLRRQALLARTIMTLPDYTRGPEQDFALAGALGHLMDQVYTEGLDLKRLPELVADRELAKHWEITVKFLEILSETWPAVLAEQGVIDAADRRNRLINALAGHWQAHPAQSPVIAAGSTGSIPASARLLRVISGLPQGRVVLPGLDQELDDESWEALDDTHPQATLRQLLQRMNSERTDVQLWPYHMPETLQMDESAALSAQKRAARSWLASEMMRPAATAQKWQNLQPDKNRQDMLRQSLSNVMRFECNTHREEARLIALLMRETLETPARTAALITPDRTLARRVATTCQRWGITLDDSGGQSLSETSCGSFLRLIMQVALQDFAPGPLAALLKHKYCHLGRAKHELIALIDRLEIELLRGPVNGCGLKSLYRRAKETHKDPALLQETEALFVSLTALCKAETRPFAKLLDAHIALAEALATSPEKSGEEILWQGDEGENAALFLAELREHTDILPAVSGQHYLDIIEQLMRTANIRPAYGTHPRLYILGQLEARLVKADLVILAGLNEGTWPPDAGNDPWMSRPMRRDFALPTPERSIGLAAHDFVQGFCNDHVVLTHARRVDGTPTVRARWLQRLDTVLEALDIKQPFQQGAYLQLAEALDRPEGPPQPFERPAPRPPVAARPEELYVTAIEKWMRDPYSIYARYILRLKKLPALEEQADAAQRGTMMHDVLDRFVNEYPDNLPEDADDRLLALGREMLAEQLEEPRLWGFWWPRFERLGTWFVNHERQWRLTAKPAKTEIAGSATLEIDDKPFTISAKADRIDRFNDGSYAIIDYKTGTSPANKDINAGYAPQLPLEAVILLENGFPDLTPDDVSYTGFWKMSGGTLAGEEKAIASDPEQARQGLIRLVRAFRDPETPYYSLPRPDKAPPAAWQDYAHLARIQEWAALEDSGEEAA